MGVASTHYVTREVAIKTIKKRIKKMSDQQLGDVLDIAVSNCFYNFRVVPEIILEEEKQKTFSSTIECYEHMPDQNEYQS